MMTVSKAGLSTSQLASGLLVTVMKSDPRDMAVTPSTRNNSSASGESFVSFSEVKNSVPDGMTGRPGLNFSVNGLGVCSVCMNIKIHYHQFIFTNIAPGAAVGKREF